MGMFDELVCDRPLPVPPDDGFQTKDIVETPTMSVYRITEGGQLVCDHANRGFTGLCPYDVGPVPLTGKVRFYDMLGSNGWIEYEAEFSRGALIAIRLVEHTPEVGK